MIQKAAAMGNWWLAASSRQCACLCITSHAEFFWQNIKSFRGFSTLPTRFGTLWLWLFPKLKSPLKRKRFQTVNEIQENKTGQLRVIGGAVWHSKVPVLKVTEAYCPMYNVSCIFFNKCLYFSYYMAGYLLDRPHINRLFSDAEWSQGTRLYSSLWYH